MLHLAELNACSTLSSISEAESERFSGHLLMYSSDSNPRGVRDSESDAYEASDRASPRPPYLRPCIRRPAGHIPRRRSGRCGHRNL